MPMKGVGAASWRRSAAWLKSLPQKDRPPLGPASWWRRKSIRPGCHWPNSPVKDLDTTNICLYYGGMSIGEGKLCPSSSPRPSATAPGRRSSSTAASSARSWSGCGMWSICSRSSSPSSRDASRRPTSGMAMATSAPSTGSASTAASAVGRPRTGSRSVSTSSGCRSRQPLWRRAGSASATWR